MSRKVAANKSRKVAATKSRKVAATKSSKTNLHTKNSQAATMPQLAAAAKPHACCLFAAIHCERPFISIRDGLCHTVKCLNFGTPEIFAVLYLKCKQRPKLRVFFQNSANGIANSEHPDGAF